MMNLPQSDMQGLLAQALRQRAPQPQPAPQQVPPADMGAPQGGGNPLTAEIAQHLQAIEAAMQQTQDPQELQRLAMAARQLMEQLQQQGGGGQAPQVGFPNPLPSEMGF